MLILMAGLPGTGKSTLARELAARIGGHVLDKDVVRGALFGPEAVEYRTEQDDVVVRAMLQAAAYLLDKNPDRCVFIDGRVFSRTYQVEEAVGFAEGIGTPWRIIECVCSEETARRRIEDDRKTNSHVATNRSFALYQEVAARFQPITHEKTVIDTDRPIEECVSAALQAIR